MADAKRITIKILRGIGKGFCYIGKGLWWFGKAVSRDIERSYQRHQQQERIRAIRRAELNDIEEENRAAGRGWARGQADIRYEERLRRQEDREQREYSNRVKKWYDVPQVNESAFLGDTQNKRKKKRSAFDF